MGKKKPKIIMRTLHRYTGYFIAGILFIYAITGFMLVFRDTPAFKRPVPVDVTIEKGLGEKDLAKTLKADKQFNLRDFAVATNEGEIITFKKNRYNTEGTYNASTGEIKYGSLEYPVLVSKLYDFHKAKISNPLSYINLLMAVSILFLVVSSFWMFDMRSKMFRKGMIFTAAGIVIALIMLFL